ncbi:AMP-binding protein [Roseibium sp. FZY0029]|uniref:AMP-binding protein n=1 Tax=Roseibium sp. FZY0029 TaxID=3116647 RepID=UPI002EC9BA75|nr:AMP-binding protein [Roseibium sp. FZY0029]
MAFVGDSLGRFASQKASAPALTCGAHSFSWQNLAERVAQIENALSTRSRRGGYVVLRLRDPASLIVCFLACARIGRIATIMDPDWPAAQAATVLEAIAPDLVIDDEVFPALRAGGPAPSAALIAPETPPDEDDLFYAGFTSGSSGVPKGYVRSHGSWLESFRLSARAFGISDQSRVVVPGQLTHSLHLYGAVCGLACGQHVVLMPRFDPRVVLRDLGSAAEGSVLYATPTQLHFLAEKARRSGAVAAVKQVLASGAKWSEADRQTLRSVFPQAHLFEFYGASETSFITLASLEDDIPPGSVGRAAYGVEIAIGDPADPVSPGRAGVIWVRSGLLFSHYICGTAPETLWQDGWLTVGDHGFLDEQGFLFLTGRENRMVITAGLNVYPEEVEAVLAEHPSVALAVVAGLPDRVRGHRLEAVVELKAPLADAKQILLRHCRGRLIAGKVPKHIHIRAKLPLTPGGKPDIQKVVADLAKEGGSG